MNVPTTRLFSNLAATAAAFALAAAGPGRADAPVKSLAGLSKPQIKALPDNEKIQINGKVWTRSQVKLELEKGRAQVRTDLESQVRAKLSAFEQMKVRHAAAQAEKARTLRASALAEAGRIAAHAPTPSGTIPTPVTPADPKITSVGAAYVMPGSSFMVAGQALGAQPGTARLEGQFPGGGQVLVVEIWKNNFAVLSVPENASGAIRQTARVALKRQDGKSANTLPVLFEPLTEMKVLGRNDPIIVCSLAADINNCDPLPGKTFEGTHANTIDVSPDEGHDKFKVNLKNGWVVESSDFVKGGFTLILGGAFPATVSGITVGASTFDIQVNFSVNPFTNIEYYGLVYIRGPVGTSHK
ncbi:MAG: hypothetical protein NEA02_08125 [Thermoanaerobaculia bacterium]|nr:hypothetical protein [Thermoanaerobaculia bacterium]